VKKGYLIEAALLHHLQALRELSLDVIIPARLVVTNDSGQAVLKQIEKPQRATQAMRELFGNRLALSVRKLRPADDRSAFESGDPDLDRFFKRFAGQNQFKHYVGTTYVAEDDGCLLGFATVSARRSRSGSSPPPSKVDFPGILRCRPPDRSPHSLATIARISSSFPVSCQRISETGMIPAE
jgi:hypothetical protein